MSDVIKQKLKQLSTLSRKVYGIRELESISFKQHPQFVKDVIRDMTNISYNLAIADHVASEDEKELLLYALKVIFYPSGNVNPKFLQSIGAQFDAFETDTPEIDSPILILEQSKKYDTKTGEALTEVLRELIVDYAEALVMSDGFESVKEFDVLETFKFWVYG